MIVCMHTCMRLCVSYRAFLLNKPRTARAALEHLNVVSTN